jgi:hypothetical protein
VYAFFVPGTQDSSSGFIQFARLPWKQALDAPGARQIGHVKNLMLSRPYFTRIPDQSVIIGDAGEGSAHIGATRDRTGSYMMLYLPLGQPVVVDLQKISGSKAKAWWYDPRTGHTEPVGIAFATNQSQKFVPPSSGRGNDWVLVLDDATKGFPAPGLSAEVLSRSGDRPADQSH